MPQNDVTFSKDTVISEDEQREIISRIEEIAGVKHQDSQVESIKPQKRFKFALYVNVIALALLLIGFVILLIFNAQKIKPTSHNGITELSSAEGKLIQELRREAAIQLGNTEGNIAELTKKIQDIVDEVESIKAVRDSKIESRRMELQASGSSPRQITQALESYKAQLIAETAEKEANLASLEAEYKADLEVLQNERMKIVKDIRIKEANIGESRGENADLEILKSLNDDEDQAEFFRRQVLSYYKAIEDSVRDAKIQQASERLSDLRNFADAPAMQRVRIVREQREVTNAAIDALDNVINLVSGKAFSDAERAWNVAMAERDRNIAGLKWQISQMQTEIDYLQPTNQAEIIAQQQNEIKALQSDLNQQLEQIAKHEAQIRELSKQIVIQTQTIGDRDRKINELDAQIQNQRALIAEREKTIADLRTLAESLQQTISDRETTISTLRTEIATLNSTISARDRTIKDNNTKIAIQEQTINQRDRTISGLRTDIENHSQTISERDKTIIELQSQSSGSQESISERDNIIADLRTQTVLLQQNVSELKNTITKLNGDAIRLNQTITENKRQIDQLTLQNKNSQQTIDGLNETIQLLMPKGE